MISETLKMLPITYEEFIVKWGLTDPLEYRAYLLCNRRQHHYGIFSGISSWYKYQISNKRI